MAGPHGGIDSRQIVFERAGDVRHPLPGQQQRGVTEPAALAVRDDAAGAHTSAGTLRTTTTVPPISQASVVAPGFVSPVRHRAHFMASAFS